MDAKKAEEHAALVAREVVARGFASQEAMRQAYFEYVEVVRRQGPKGTFPQFLAARNVVDKAKLQTLQTLTPTSDRLNSLANSQATFVGLGTASSRGNLPAIPPPAPPPTIDEGGEGGVTMQLAPGAIAAQLAEAAARRAPTPPPAATPTVRFPGGAPPPGSPAYTPPPPGSATFASGTRNIAPAPTPAAHTPPPPAFTPPPVTSSGARPAVRKPAPMPPVPDSVDELAVPDDSDDTGIDIDSIEILPDKKGQIPGTMADPETHRSSHDQTLDEDAQAVKALLAKGNLTESEEADEPEPEPEVKEVVFESAEGLTPQGEPPLGAKLGKYQILGLLGRGGMAVVYRVRNAESGREYAMKVLTGGDRPGGEKRRARFRREVRAVMRLDHPNIVKIHDSGKSGPLDFYIMDLIDGEDFEKALQKDKFELEKRLEIVEGICRAMAHAHERGVIHRDLKPQNVLLDIRAKPKVVDFGLAKVSNDEVSLTRTNTALGTPFYMAPEQHKNAKDIDQRADVFALGVIIYECATGQRPFTGETAAEVGHKVLTMDPPLPSKVRPGKVPPAIDAIVAKALEKDPTRRYPSAGALLVDLIRARAGKDVFAKGSVGLQASVRKFVERNKAAVVSGTVVAVLFLPIVVYLAFKGGKKPDARPPRVSPSPDENPSTRPSPAPSVSALVPSPAPTASSRPIAPKPSPTPSPSGSRPAPSPTPSPGAPPSPEPSPGATTKPPSALELIRAEFKFPEEPRQSGAEAEANALTPDQRRDFWNALDRLIETPLAHGDLEGARDGLSRLANDSEVQTLHALAADELRHDLELLGKLRKLIVERVRGDDRPLQNADVFECGRGSLRGPPKLVPGDLLEFSLGNGRATVDPLALGTSTLRSFLANEPSGVKLALGILAVHRGEDGSPELKPLADAHPVAAHRLAWTSAAKDAREAGLAALEATAAEDWRWIQENKSKTHAGNLEKLEAKLDAFVAAYGRFEPFRSRRADWVAIARDAVPYERRLAATVQDKKKLSLDFHWRVEDKRHARDLEVMGRDPKSGFRADWQNAGLFLENAIVAFPTDDRRVYWSKVEFTSEESAPVLLLAGDCKIELDPNADWALRDERDIVVKREKSRHWSLNSTHALEFIRSDEKEPKLTGHLGREDLFLALSLDKVDRPLQVARNRIGISVDRARVSDVEGSIAKAPPQSMHEKLIETRYQERYLVESRANALRRLARVVVPGAGPRDVVLEGDWKVDGDGALEGAGPATLTTLRDSFDGEATFEIQPDDGPGVQVEVGRSGAGALWRLPGTTLSQLVPRKVVIDYDLARNAGTATCVVDDAIRLETRTRVPLEKGPLRITLIDRTRATIRNLKVIELSRGR